MFGEETKTVKKLQLNIVIVAAKDRCSSFLPLIASADWLHWNVNISNEFLLL